VVENLLSVGGVVVKINKNALANFSYTNLSFFLIESFVSGKKPEFNRMETCCTFHTKLLQFHLF